MRSELPVPRSRYYFRYAYPPINRLSGSCVAALRRLELARFCPGDTAKAFRHWATLAHGPLRQMADPFTSSRCGIPECGCDPGYARDHLEEVMHALPKKSSRELRQLVRELDRTILKRAKVIRAHSPDTPWWRDQL
ncbi:hypothetical protein GCM10010449_40700 [Streptomyces rectiviolaceus]|uniref:Transposase n=1 Tax=Streptomyces rectiviolaceus TaxID=332591 RepID=A0ABP6MIZ5_9ACTN